MIKRNLKTIFFIFIFICNIVCCTKDSTPQNPVIKNGILDLRNWNFQKDGPVQLSGEWKFKWLKDKIEYSYPDYDDSNWDILSVPGDWSNKTNEPHGYCWIRLTILVNPKSIEKVSKELAIAQLHEINCAYKMYFNSKEILHAGKTKSRIHSEIPEYKQQIKIINQDLNKDKIIIALKISNYNFILGGLHRAPIFGTYDQLNSIFLKEISINYIVLGILIMMILYHSFLWLARREDKTSLYFALFCIAPLFRVIMTTQVYKIIFPNFNHYNLHQNISFLSLPLLFLFAPTFYASLFSKEFNRKLLRCFQLIGIICFIFIAVTPVNVFAQFMKFYEFTLFILLVWIIISLVRAYLHKQEGAWLILIGMLIIFLAVINDLFHSLGLINTGFYSQIGFLGLIFSQSSVLSIRFARAHRTAEHLSENLQKEVDIKTNDLNQRTIESEEANKKLKEMDNFKNIFFQNITHELRTPLTLIMGHIEQSIQQSYENDPEVLKRRQESILHNSHRLLRLINQLLDISKIDAKMMNLKTESLNIIKLLQYITASFESIAQRKKIDYTINFDIDNLYGQYDREKIEKIFFNLLSNAFKFTGESGIIRFTLSSSDDNITIILQDTGAGIPEEMLPNIFDRFYQADGTLTREHEGTGIGLTLVQEYIEMHNGTIQVESSMDTGTIFTIMLPVTTDQNIAFDDGDDAIKSNERHKTYMSELDIVESNNIHQKQVREILLLSDEKLSILIIDDNSDMRNYIKDILKEQFLLYEAENGLLGLEIVKKKKVDLIITDIMMPKMDGHQFLKKLKSQEETSHIPVIMLTAKVSIEEKIEGLESGADDYLSKPFNARELVSRIDSLMKIYEYQRIITDKNRVIEAELDLARQIQSRLLPDLESGNFIFDLHAVYLPMHKVGGDFYEYLEDETDTRICIADVSGHGIAAAFLALIIKIELINAIAMTDETNSVLMRLHNVVSQYTVNSNYATAFYCIINNETKEMQFCCAGHPPPILYRSKDDTMIELRTKGILLGLFSSIKLEEKTILLESGDRLIFYTDGIIESFNEKNEIFGEDRFAALIKNNASLKPEKLSEKIIQEITEFTGSDDFEDDITLLVVDIP